MKAHYIIAAIALVVLSDIAKSSTIGNNGPRRPLCPLFQIPEGGCTEPPSSVTCEDLRCEQYNQTCCSRACGAKFCFGVRLDDD